MTPDIVDSLRCQGRQSAKTVYDFYRNHENPPKRGHLYDHYKRGLAGIMEPSTSARLAHAAWRAGRDRAKAESK